MPRRPVKLNEWNDVTIIARGPRLIHKVNGEVTVEVVDREKAAAARSGLLAVQLHQGTPMRVEVTDIRLRDMAPRQDESGADPLPVGAIELPWPGRQNR